MGVISSKSTEQLVLISLVLFILKCVGYTQAEVSTDFDIPFALNDIDTQMEPLTDSATNQLLSNTNLDKASIVLAKLLLMPWPKGGSPILYVESPKSAQEDNDFHLNDIETGDSLRPIGSKRSKYYRKYPWKRQQNNMRISENLKSGPSNEIQKHDIETDDNLTSLASKRSKYFRKCFRKRRQKMRYDPAYMCIPNKDDVFRLLVAIHGERDGYKGQLVDFCNRKRPASLVFTNIRYVG